VRSSGLAATEVRYNRIAQRIGGRRLALFLDYDGTLTPIVARPELAVLAPAMGESTKPRSEDMSDRRTQLIQDVYGAFGRGDIPAVLARLAEGVDWAVNVDPNVPGVSEIPWLKRCRGRAEVAEFFRSLGQGLEFHKFEPLAFFEGNDQVLAHLTVEVTFKKTGRRFATDAIHQFVFGPGDLVTRFRDYFDTAAELAAAKP